ncbi:hypothetical protein CY34DRAFT_813063 [Suillus luteus UH-Slu-Lm8-n1]|uniref:Uncharacterized protein n=1 Tax=Suillus luteus UH-Slu-Lm8-n1 TaxID=930992 RepID=A0A0C9ZXM2_9AGAM|nr:hypothetical protein CY34DRAFT_813063 [Suillus luteus UH-Slu-Lm8-n1]
MINTGVENEKSVRGGETCQIFAPSEIILPIYTTISSSAIHSAYYAIIAEATGKHDLPPPPCMPIFPDSVDAFDEEDRYKDAWCRADSDGCWLSGINCKSSTFAICCYGVGFLPHGRAQLLGEILREYAGRVDVMKILP